MPPKKVAERILPLTSARFFAALLVVFYHWWPAVNGHKFQDGVGTRIAALGYISVSFFFMLSGFILAIVYLDSGHALDKRRFFVSRFARLYPLYVASILLDLPHFLFTQRYVTYREVGQTVGVVVGSFAFLQAWFPVLCKINTPSWSLSAEAFFYAVFPLLGTAIAGLRLRTALILSVLAYVSGFWLMHLLLQTGQTLFPVPHLLSFALGIVLARLFRWIGAAHRRKTVLQRLAPAMLLMSLAMFLAIPAFSLPLSEVLMQHGLLAPLFAIAILALASGNEWISWLLAPKWLVVLGEASFGLYLIHMPVARILRRFIEAGGVYAFFAYLALIIGLSVLSLKFFETPARLWILKREKTRSAETLVTSSLMQ